ncbi:LysR substrate-binding domain-containing protein [Shewanella salipaludis]|uniref:LysR family transcriptional regulator n=1 Tax=Shewanella salipaludis TaxID=2723052 RepID=A0A972FW81_9GAMM|nr:LysR substrate-binding domain-containing protein [Shewanella salipaludis]NMH66911.1 LysR family transcriptional regulator [Shewanella salipaludis]
MQDLNDLYFYVQVVLHNGFSPASRALNLPKSKLSRRVALLEERLGVRLIQRSSRQFIVTDIGKEYFSHCQAMLVEAQAAQAVIDMNQTEPQGLIRLSCPPALLYSSLGDMLARFMVDNPKIQMQLDVTNRNVDVLAEGLDLALRVRFPPLEDTDLVMKVLAESPQKLVCHPGLLQGIPAPQVPEDLAQLPSLGLDGASQQGIWQLEGPAGATVQWRHEPRLIVNDMVGLQAAALQGVGIASLPALIVHQDLLAGRLVEVLPLWVPRSGILHAIYPSRRCLLPKVRSLLDFLAAECSRLSQADIGLRQTG